MIVFDDDIFNDADRTVCVCLCKNACFHRNENFASGEMKTNRQQNVLFHAFTIPRVLKYFRFV